MQKIHHEMQRIDATILADVRPQVVFLNLCEDYNVFTLQELYCMTKEKEELCLCVQRIMYTSETYFWSPRVTWEQLRILMMLHVLRRLVFLIA